MAHLRTCWREERENELVPDGNLWPYNVGEVCIVSIESVCKRVLALQWECESVALAERDHSAGVDQTFALSHRQVTNTDLTPSGHQTDLTLWGHQHWSLISCCWSFCLWKQHHLSILFFKFVLYLISEQRLSSSLIEPIMTRTSKQKEWRLKQTLDKWKKAMSFCEKLEHSDKLWFWNTPKLFWKNKIGSDELWKTQRSEKCSERLCPRQADLPIKYSAWYHRCFCFNGLINCQTSKKTLWWSDRRV